MYNKIFIGLLFCLPLINPSLHKNHAVSKALAISQQEPVLMKAGGAKQFSGVGYYATTDECDYEGMGAAYAVRMTGDLEGCLYAFIDAYECSPSGTYREVGREYFVGTYNGKYGTFWTTYKFEAKYEGCAENGAPLGAEIFGRCQHPLVAGSGTGVFSGATGRLDMKDNVEEGSFPYRGHLRF
jgi:hypothetical protein